jgi:AraC-like DNA-binding protein
MEQWEKIEAVQKMQDYIKAHVTDENMNFDEMYSAASYSRRHADRIFKDLLGLTPLEYIRNIRISESSMKLLHNNETILDIALDSNFKSHEGYTRAFTEHFGISPNNYRKEQMPIPLFVQYPVRSYYTYLYHKEDLKMSKETLLCMISVVSRPKRKLIVLRSTKGQDYWSFCEEMGCEWEGLLNSIPVKYDTAAIVELPDRLVTEGTTHVAAGVEIPLDYNGKIPKGYEVTELEPCEMLYFQTEPFEKDEDFGEAIDCVFRAINKYDAAKYGYEYAFDLAPKFNYGASKDIGARQAMPIRRL